MKEIQEKTEVSVTSKLKEAFEQIKNSAEDALQCLEHDDAIFDCAEEIKHQITILKWIGY